MVITRFRDHATLSEGLTNYSPMFPNVMFLFVSPA